MTNAVPVFEAKNKLPFYIHKAEEEGPVILSRRNSDVAVIISIEEYKALLEDRKAARKNLNIVEKAGLFREKNKGLYKNDDAGEEFSKMLEQIRAEEKPSENYGHCWDDVLEDWK